MSLYDDEYDGAIKCGGILAAAFQFGANAAICNWSKILLKLHHCESKILTNSSVYSPKSGSTPYNMIIRNEDE